ncbi:MAG: dUTP diphosphatase [Alphaproteobacteria bacterium]|nr:dUTP diphosphatase [Alphaproteobacteria bacterium]
MNSGGAAPVAIRRLPHGRDLALPAYATPGSAGLDLSAAIEQDILLAPGERRLVATGFALALPAGFEAQVRPRSGLALEHGLTVLNAPGTIDCDYRGEVAVLLVNLGDKPVRLSRGQRIAQLVLARVERARLELSDELPGTARGGAGFGSSGR